MVFLYLYFCDLENGIAYIFHFRDLYYNVNITFLCTTLDIFGSLCYQRKYNCNLPSNFTHPLPEHSALSAEQKCQDAYLISSHLE